MKKTRLYIFVMATMCAMPPVMAEDHFPALASWTEEWASDDPGAEQSSQIIYKVGWDVTKDGVTYRPIKINGKDAGMWIREEDGKVFLLREDYPKEILLYDFGWEGKESFNRQYLLNGELHEETIPITSVKQMAVGDHGSWSLYDYIEVGSTKLIKGIGLIEERQRDCCLLGSCVTNPTQSEGGRWRLIRFSRGDGCSPVFKYKNKDVIHDFFSYGGIRSGVEIYFYSPWPYVQPLSRHELDSIRGNTIYLSSHFDSSASGQTFQSGRVCLGRLEAGDYIVSMTSVDEAEQKAENAGVPEHTDISFTVSENPADVPSGFVLSNWQKEEKKEEWWLEEGYKPEINIAQEGDSLHITGWMVFDCGQEHFCYYEIHGDSIHLETSSFSSNGVAYFSIAPYSVDFKIGPFIGKRCKVRTIENIMNGCIESTSLFDFTSVSSVFSDEKSSLNTYDLTGRPADGTKKGIYIRNGKKVMMR